MKIRHVLLSSAVAAALSAPAMADNLTVSTATTSALTTAAASGGTAGNITVATAGSVTVSTSGPAITIDSNNAVVINQGNISNTASASAVAVSLLAGNTGSFTNLGTITVPGTGTPPSSTGQYGVLVNGNGTFTGDITTGSASNISVSGVSGAGIAVQAELAGNLTLAGNITSTGTTSSGVAASAAIDGAFVNRGAILAVSGSTSTENFNPLAGIAAGFGGNIGGGFLNAGPLNGSDTTAAASIKTSAVLPAVEIAPGLAATTGNISVGIVSDTTNPGFSFINRGLIANDGTQPGVSTQGVQIGNTAGDTSGKTTVFAGGLYNSGTIRATATSDNALATKTATAASSANAMLFGVGASVPTLVNTTTGNITATTGGPLGGEATALWIQSGGSLTTLSNAGKITASAVVTDTAVTSLSSYAIRDAAGTLTQIDNSGTISATASTLSNNAQIAVAVDASASALAMNFNNSGVVTGNVRFGSNAASQLTISGTNASVAGNISTVGAGRVAIAVSPTGAGGRLETGLVSRASTFTVGSGGTVTFDVGQSTTVVNASGAASFDANSHILLKPVSLLSPGNISLVHSDTSLTINGNLSTISSGVTVPFLYTSTVSADSKNLTLTVARKSASALGLTGAAAAIYEPALSAATSNTSLAAALGTLPDAQSLQSALQTFRPVDAGYLLSAAAFLTDPNADPIGARQRRLMLASRGEGFALWTAAGYESFSFDAADGHGFGGTIGGDFQAAQKSHFGLAITLKGTHLKEDENSGLTRATWYLFSPYLGFTAGNVFLNAQLNAGGATVNTRRTVTVGTQSFTPGGSTSETLASGGVTAGYLLTYGGWSFAPQISFSALKMSNGAYSESGGGTGIDLTVNAEDLTSTHAFAGFAASSSYELFGGQLVPHFLAGWNQTIGSSGVTTTANFVSKSSASFSVTGPQTEHSGFLGSAHLDFDSDTTTVSVGYDGFVGGKSNMQSARFRISKKF